MSLNVSHDNIKEGETQSRYPITKVCSVLVAIQLACLAIGYFQHIEKPLLTMQPHQMLTGCLILLGMILIAVESARPTSSIQYALAPAFCLTYAYSIALAVHVFGFDRVLLVTSGFVIAPLSLILGQMAMSVGVIDFSIVLAGFTLLHLLSFTIAIRYQPLPAVQACLVVSFTYAVHLFSHVIETPDTDMNLLTRVIRSTSSVVARLVRLIETVGGVQ